MVDLWAVTGAIASRQRLTGRATFHTAFSFVAAIRLMAICGPFQQLLAAELIDLKALPSGIFHLRWIDCFLKKVPQFIYFRSIMVS